MMKSPISLVLAAPRRARLAFVVPSATPAAAVQRLQRLQQETAAALAQPALIEKLAKIGAEPFVMSPADFTAFILGELEVGAGNAKAASLKAP